MGGAGTYNRYETGHGDAADSASEIHKLMKSIARGVEHRDPRNNGLSPNSGVEPAKETLTAINGRYEFYYPDIS